MDQYGVVGHPVSHSLSPFIHGMFARETGQDITYRLFDVRPADLEVHVRDFFAQGGRRPERHPAPQDRGAGARP